MLTDKDYIPTYTALSRFIDSRKEAVAPASFIIRLAIYFQFYDSPTAILTVDRSIDVNVLSLLHCTLEMEHGLSGLGDLREVVNDIVNGAAEDGIHFSVVRHLTTPCPLQSLIFLLTPCLLCCTQYSLLVCVTHRVGRPTAFPGTVCDTEVGVVGYISVSDKISLAAAILSHADGLAVLGGVSA